MELPYMKYSASRTAQQIVQFGGLRYGRGGHDGDFSETLNLSSRQFPALSQRGARVKYASYDNATALFARDKLVVVDGTNFIYDGETVGQVTAGEKMITSVNSKIIIFPDKKYYDTATGTFADMGVKITAAKGNVTWSENSLAISGAGNLTQKFAANQAVEISGSSIAANNLTLVIQSVESGKLIFAADSFSTGTEANTVTVERKVPDFVCICESANRLWGAEGDTIWASALGDPLTFYNYSGLSTDSFAVAVGTSGDFTACVAYSSNVLFFKENALHKVLGTAPDEYRVYDYTIPGVQSGSAKSLEVINEILFYKGEAGVYSYNGSTPSLISENFGIRRFDSASAGSDGTKYYISMRDVESNEYSMYVFDPTYGVWLREDNTHVIDFARHDTLLHYLNAADGDVYIVEQDDDSEDAFRWEALFYPFDDTVYGKRGYSKLWLKMELAPEAWVKAEISEDAEPFRHAGVWSGEKPTVTAQIFPGRCDTFRLRLTGFGRCVIKSLVREFDVGSTV